MTDVDKAGDVKCDKLEKLLRQFQRYYTINRETPLEPFTAQPSSRQYSVNSIS